MQHENSTLKPVTQARAQTMATGGNVQQRAVAESALTQAVGKLLAIAKTIRSCGAIEGVQQLQEQFVSTENRIAYARQFYNDEVMKYSTVQATFPPSLFAAQLGFSPSAMFAAADAERTNVQVKL